MLSGTPMTQPKPPASANPRTGASFRKRYDELENRRTALIGRLERLGEQARSHPHYKNALKLLNATFRRSTLAQRLGILQAATWLVDLLERFGPLV